MTRYGLIPISQATWRRSFGRKRAGLQLLTLSIKPRSS